MIIYGEYIEIAGIYRPFVRALIKTAKEDYLPLSFLVDSGADGTFLPYRIINKLGIDMSKGEEEKIN